MENFLKNIKRDLSKWRNIQCLWKQRFNTIRMSIPSKMIIIIMQFQQNFRWNLELILNLHGRRKSPPIAKNNSKKKSEENKFTLPDIKTYCTELSFLCFMAASTSYLFYTWDGGWEWDPKGRGYMHTLKWFILLYNRSITL